MAATLAIAENNNLQLGLTICGITIGSCCKRSILSARVIFLLDLREAPATWDWRATDEKREIRVIRVATVIREPNPRKSVATDL